MASKRAPIGEVQKIECRACGQPRALDDYRIYATKPEVLHMDFCVHCEKQHGTLVLYRRYNAYGTPQIIEAVFAANRVPEGHRTPEMARLLVEPKAAADPETNEELFHREMARRELARRRLIYYVKSMMPDYVPGWLHQDVCRRLEKFLRDVEQNKSPRLVLAVPPRHGKSQLASDMFPSWVLGQHPDWPIIVSSYSLELPVEFSRNIRDRLKSDEHKALFPDTVIRPDATGVESWKTTRGGGLKAAGVGVGLTGFGGRILIADDLIKDAEAAASDVIRTNAWNWYKMVFRSRVAPGGGILLIGTRWHWHDPIGRSLELDAQLAKEGVPEYERENWEVVSYPAIAEADEHLMRDGTIFRGEAQPDDPELLRTLRRKGEALHPERWPLNELRKVRNVYTVSDWSALYQQNPTPEEGDFFRKGDFRYRWLDPAYRQLCRVFLTVDYAIAKKQRNDFTVAGVFALDSNDDLYCLEVRRGRWGTQEIATNVADLVEKHKVELYAGEQGAIHHAVWPVIKQELDRRRLYISVDETLVPIQDKETRARPLQGRVQRHKFFFSYDEAARPDILDVAEREMLQFPNGVHDDIVDMLAWGARLAMNVSLPNAQRVPERQKSWTDQITSGQKVDSFMAA
jgi:predicted phage terminase large subunit-like protein